MSETTTEVDPKMKAQIDAMSREDMAGAWRYAGAGDPRFAGAAGRYFAERFKSLGGFNSRISKAIDR